jgi:hypothetical protein
MLALGELARNEDRGKLAGGRRRRDRNRRCNQERGRERLNADAAQTGHRSIIGQTGACGNRQGRARRRNA